MGILQATEALKLLLEIGEPLVGRLLIYDALDSTLHGAEAAARSALPGVRRRRQEADATSAGPARLRSRRSRWWRARMTAVRIPPVLRTQAGNNKQVEVDGRRPSARSSTALVGAVPGAARAADDRRRRPQPLRQRLRQRARRPLRAGACDAGRRVGHGDPAARDGGRLRAAADRRCADADRLPPETPAAASRARRPLRLDRRRDRPHAAGRDPADVARTRACGCYAKLEFMNPTGSVKDRVARAPDRGPGALGPARPDSIILEPTSGNTGIALAMIARRKGYRIAVVMPENVTRERRSAADAVRRRDHRVAAELGSNGAVAMAKQLVAEDSRYVMPYQYGNPANPRAHDETTAAEIIADCPEVDAFVGGLGTGGTLMGVGRRTARAQPAACKHLRRRAAPGRRGPGPPLARRGLHPRDLRPERARREVPRLQRRIDRGAARPDRARGHLRGRLVGRRPGRGRARGARPWRAARS